MALVGEFLIKQEGEALNAKREEIREGIAEIALEYNYDMNSEELSHKVVEYLHSQRVVIQVESSGSPTLMPLVAVESLI